jgi:glycolate oxidase FAD binding subunit
MAEGAEVAIPLQGKEQDVFWRFITDHLPKEGRQDSRQNVRGKASLPVSQVGAFIADAERISQEAGDGAEIVAHGASGVVYFMCSEEDISPAKVTTLRKRANELGGWLTLECAPTAIKRQVSVWDSPPGGLEVMKRIRAYFDPKRTLNPGRFLV